MPMMDQEMPMDEESPMEDKAEGGEENENDTVSAFVPMTFFNRTVKAGDMEKVEIVDVDPESNEVQIKCTYGKDEGSSGGDYNSDFDRAMPEETEE